MYRKQGLILFDYTWRVPASTPGWHAAVALMTGCEAHPTMYRKGEGREADTRSGSLIR
jgi:hypothetical protein